MFSFVQLCVMQVQVEIFISRYLCLYLSLKHLFHTCSKWLSTQYTLHTMTVKGMVVLGKPAYKDNFAAISLHESWELPVTTIRNAFALFYQMAVARDSSMRPSDVLFFSALCFIFTRFGFRCKRCGEHKNVCKKTHTQNPPTFFLPVLNTSLWLFVAIFSSDPLMFGRTGKS